MYVVKVVFKVEDIKTGGVDTIVKTGNFCNTPDSLHQAYAEGLRDKYVFAPKDVTYTVPDHAFSIPAVNTAAGMFDERDMQGKLLKRVKFTAKLSKIGVDNVKAAKVSRRLVRQR